MLVTNAVAALTNGYGCYDSGKDSAPPTRHAQWAFVRWPTDGHARVIQSAASRWGDDSSAEGGHLEQKTDEAEPPAAGKPPSGAYFSPLLEWAFIRSLI